MKKIIRPILMLSGAAFVINATLFGAVSVFTFGIAAVLLAGIVLFTAGFYFDAVISSRGILRVFCVLAALALTLSLAMSVFLAVRGSVDTADYTEDALIVLGAGLHGETVSFPLQYRLDRAVSYNRKNPDATIIVSGGMGYGETVTESFAMKKYLVAHGVPADKIFEENRSTSTYENFCFSKEILDNLFSTDCKTAFVTNRFHVFRADKLASEAGLSPGHLGAKIQWYSVLPNYMRECAALVKYFILKK